MKVGDRVVDEETGRTAIIVGFDADGDPEVEWESVETTPKNTTGSDYFDLLAADEQRKQENIAAGRHPNYRAIEDAPKNALTHMRRT